MHNEGAKSRRKDTGAILTYYKTSSERWYTVFPEAITWKWAQEVLRSSTNLLMMFREQIGASKNGRCTPNQPSSP